MTRSSGRQPCLNPACDRTVKDAIACCTPCASAHFAHQPIAHSERCDQLAAERAATERNQ